MIGMYSFSTHGTHWAFLNFPSLSFVCVCVCGFLNFIYFLIEG